MGYVDKVPSKKTRSGFVHRARWREANGRQRSKSFATNAEAVRHLSRVEQSVGDGTYVDFREAQRWTVSTWWEHWWPIEQVRLRPSPRSRDERMFRLHIKPRLGDVRLDRLDELTVDSWAADMITGVHRRPLAPASAQHAVQILSRMMAGAIRARILVVNPAAGVAMPPRSDEEMMCLEAAELGHLVDTAVTWRRVVGPAKKRGRALPEDVAAERGIETARLLTVLGWCALRFGEAAALQAGDVDLVRGTARITKGYAEVDGVMHLGTPKTKAGKRTVPLAPQVVEALKVQCAGKGSRDLVFALPRGGPLRINAWRAQTFKPITAAAGFEGLRVHDLRHTGITLWLAVGASPHEVASWAGHKSAATVMDRYGHVTPSRTIDVMRRLGEMADAPDAEVIQLRDHRPAADDT